MRCNFSTLPRRLNRRPRLTSFFDACYGQPSMARSLVLIAIVLVASGCATRASYQRLTADVAALRGDVNDLRQAQDATTRDVARAAAEARSLEARVGELVATQTTAAKEVSALRDRVETAET